MINTCTTKLVLHYQAFAAQATNFSSFYKLYNRNAIALTEIWNEFLLHALYLIENIFILFVDNYDMYYKNKILLNSISAAI